MINVTRATLIEELIAIFDVDTDILECFLVFFKMPLNNGNTLYSSYEIGDYPYSVAHLLLIQNEIQIGDSSGWK